MVSDNPRDDAARAFLDDEDAESVPYDPCEYESGNQSWLILDDDEADDRAADYIRESLWAFNGWFLANYMPESIDSEHLKRVQELYEDANPILLTLIGDRFEELVEDAISADGRGHFLAGYDHHEVEFEHGGETWFCFRTN